MKKAAVSSFLIAVILLTCSGHSRGASAADAGGFLLVRLQADPHGSYSYVASQVLNGSCLRRLEAYIE